MFQLFATGVNDTGGKFAAGVVDTGGNLPPASVTPVANLPPVSTTQGELVANFAAGVVDTGGKFAAGVVDTGGNLPPVSTEAKAAREAVLTELSQERQQKPIRDAQELTRCLSTGMGLLKPEQLRQITNTVTGTNIEPMDTLRSFNERLETLMEENPHASSADLKEGAESAVQALIAGAKNAKERQRKPGPRQTLAVFEVLR